MKEIEKLDRIAISVRSHRLLKILMRENPELEEIMQNSKNETEVIVGVKQWTEKLIENRPAIYEYYKSEHPTRELFEKLDWHDYAIIRLMDYIEFAGIEEIWTLAARF